MLERDWLEAAYHFHIQPSEFDRLPVWRLRQLKAELEHIRAEAAKKGG